jgi:hypothetical protein
MKLKSGPKCYRIIIDSAMIILMPLLMAYSLIGEELHEIMGICCFILYLIHHYINRKWWLTLFRGKYNAFRIMNTTINILLLLYMIIQPITGLLMSKYLLKNVSVLSLSSLVRAVHLPLAYWGLILMSMHLGFHLRIKTQIKYMGIPISIYGLYAFFNRHIIDYLTMNTMFAFFDTNESRLIFLLDYVAIIILFAMISYYLKSLLIKRRIR